MSCWAQHQTGPLDLLHDLGHGERLAGSGRAAQDQMFGAGVDARDKRLDGFGLVPCRLVIGDNMEIRHGSRLSQGQALIRDHIRTFVSKITSRRRAVTIG